MSIETAIDDARSTTSSKLDAIASEAAKEHDAHNKETAALLATQNETKAKLDAANAEIVRLLGLLDEQPAPPADPNPASLVRFIGTTAGGWIEGSAPSDIDFETDAPLVAGQVVTVRVFDASSDPWPAQSEQLIATLTSGKSWKLTAAQLAGVKAGKRAIYLSLNAPKTDATHIVTVTAAGSTPAPGVKTTVTNWKPVTGGKYRDLIIKGGVRVVWQSINDVLIEDSDLINAADLMLVQAKADGSGACANWTVRRVNIIGAKRDDWGHSQGVYLEGVKGTFLFEDGVIADNGLTQGKRFNQNHNVYLAGPVETVIFRRMVLRNPAAQQIKARGFKTLLVEGCTLNGGLIGIGGDDRMDAGDVIVRDTIIKNVGGTDSNGLTLGWGINFEFIKDWGQGRKSLKSVLLDGVKFIGPAVNTNTRAVKFAGKITNKPVVTNCDFTEWAGPRIIGEYVDGGGNKGL